MFRGTLYAVAACCLWCMPAARPAAAGEVWLDVPFVAQVGNNCGPASISMVMKYWAAARHDFPGPAAEEQAIRHSLISTKAGGASVNDVARYFDDHGFHAYPFEGDWDDLEHHLSRGRPLIVGLKLSSGAFHLLVVAGIDSDHGVVLVNDPAQRKLRRLKRSDFENAWNRCGRWTLLALPDDES